jgi:hypothetical protein
MTALMCPEELTSDFGQTEVQVNDVSCHRQVNVHPTEDNAVKQCLMLAILAKKKMNDLLPACTY